MKIILAGVIENISTRQDNSFKIVLGTQEIEKNQVADLFDMRNKYCKVLFSDSGITDLEAAAIDSTSLVASKKKSHAQRLRAVLYRYFEVTGLNIEFENFYSTEMERIIDHYKSKLNQEAA